MEILRLSVNSLSGYPVILFVLTPLLAYVARFQFGLTLQVDSIAQALLFFLLAPVIEEWLFRHGLQDWLGKHFKGRFMPNLLTSIAFSCLHVQLGLMTALLWLMPSLALGELWHAKKNFILNVACHAWFNYWLYAVSQS